MRSWDEMRRRVVERKQRAPYRLRSSSYSEAREVTRIRLSPLGSRVAKASVCVPRGGDEPAIPCPLVARVPVIRVVAQLGTIDGSGASVVNVDRLVRVNSDNFTERQDCARCGDEANDESGSTHCCPQSCDDADRAEQ